MGIYRSHIVNEIISYYGKLLIPTSSESIYHHLSKLSSKMHKGLNQKESCLYTQLNNYHPDYLGVQTSILQDKSFSLSECQHSIANEYGFSSWTEVQELEHTNYNIVFEQCVTAIINGDTVSLKKSLESNAELILAKSQYGHKASLLHYTASNGIELWRQQVPMNLEDIVVILLDAGVDKNAVMNVYGGRFTAHELYSSSAHPIDSGINDSNIKKLLSL